MKYQSGEIIFIGDGVKYNGQDGCIALIGQEPESGSPFIKRNEWDMNESQILVLFKNGARLMLDNASEDNLLIFLRRKEV